MQTRNVAAEHIRDMFFALVTKLALHDVGFDLYVLFVTFEHIHLDETVMDSLQERTVLCEDHAAGAFGILKLRIAVNAGKNNFSEFAQKFKELL